jgi:hypothetical protein
LAAGPTFYPPPKLAIAPPEKFAFVALRSANTVAVNLLDSPITGEQAIHPNAEFWLAQVRPAFLGLSIGMLCEAPGTLKRL